jgi:hypothetical protein
MLEAEYSRSRVPESESHSEFLKLCALSIAGDLSAQQTVVLNEHLAKCSSCRQALREYETIAEQALPDLGADTAFSSATHSNDWSVDRAEAALFATIRREREDPEDPADAVETEPLPHVLFTSAAVWRRVWAFYSLAALLLIAIGVCAYWLGAKASANRMARQAVASLPFDGSQATAVPAEAQLSDASHDRDVALRRIQQREKEIAALRHQLQQQSIEVRRIWAEQQRLSGLLSGRAEENASLTKQLADAAERLQTAEADARATRASLTNISRQSFEDTARVRELEAQISSLNRQLQVRQGTIEQQQELLAHDRDIRELMGARDLYIAEVYDVAGTGETQKPYGRVFYTKGKSLIFYAYDLDRQTGAKDVSTFQAWGRRGPDRHQALNLGVFYVDNAAKKRWVLKLTDPKEIDEIDAVFVTVEPRGGSQKPSGTPLLFAYLRVDPNHP